MRKYLQLGWVMILSASCVHAAEIANLRNGFSIRHDHHDALGETTRLYLDSDASAGYIDVASSEIESFQTAPPEVVSPSLSPASTKDLQAIIGEASASS